MKYIDLDFQLPIIRITALFQKRAEHMDMIRDNISSSLYHPNYKKEATMR